MIAKVKGLTVRKYCPVGLSDFRIPVSAEIVCFEVGIVVCSGIAGSRSRGTETGTCAISSLLLPLSVHSEKDRQVLYLPFAHFAET